MTDFDPKIALKLAGNMASKVEDVINCTDVIMLSEYMRALKIARTDYNFYIFDHTN